MKPYHNLITVLPETELELILTEAKRGAKFYIVPTDFMLTHIDNKSLLEGCPNLVNFDLVDIIKEIKLSERYAYNSTVAEEFCTKFKCNKGDFLDSMVYCSQRYFSSIEDEENAKKLDAKLTNDGFHRASETELISLIDTKNKYQVYVKGTTFLGTDTLIKRERGLILKDWGENNGGLHWMDTRAKRSGFRAFEGQYIKPL